MPRAGEAGKQALRALVEASGHRTDWIVDTERVVPIREFQGVGPVDIVLSDADEAPAWGLIECKWSTDIRRDKIFEGAWDAVKLSLATRAHRRCGWLVTGAPTGSWSESETSDLFAAGIVQSQEIWRRPLRSPGSNGGSTVGEDCQLGGRANISRTRLLTS